MPHGTRDDANVEIDVDQYRLDDMAELAARLGSIVTMERSGRVLFAESFEAGSGAWEIATPGIGAEGVVLSTPTFQGGLAFKLTAGTGAGAVSICRKRIPAFAWNSLGLAAMFTVDGDLSYLDWQVRVYTGELLRVWTIRYDPTRKALRYLSSGGPMIDFADVGTLNTSSHAFHSIKLVVETQARSYTRCYFDGVYYDLADYQSTQVANLEQPRLDFSAWVFGDTLLDTAVVIDNVVLTFDEF